MKIKIVRRNIRQKSKTKNKRKPYKRYIKTRIRQKQKNRQKYKNTVESIQRPELECSSIIKTIEEDQTW